MKEENREIFIMVRCQNKGVSPTVTEVTAKYNPPPRQFSIIKSNLFLKRQNKFHFYFEILFTDDLLPSSFVSFKVKLESYSIF